MLECVGDCCVGGLGLVGAWATAEVAEAGAGCRRLFWFWAGAPAACVACVACTDCTDCAA